MADQKEKKQLIDRCETGEALTRYSHAVRLPGVTKFNVLDSLANPFGKRRDRQE